MNSKQNSQPVIILLFTLILLGVLLGSQCSNPPSTDTPTIEISASSTPTTEKIVPPEITLLVVSNFDELEPEEEVFIIADINTFSTETSAVVYTWNVKDGTIIVGKGTDTILYRAPKIPGVYKVSLKIEQGNQSAEKSLQITVVSPTPMPTKPPSPTSTPTPTYTPPTTVTLSQTNILTKATSTYTPTPTPTPTYTSSPTDTPTSTSTPTPEIYPSIIPDAEEPKNESGYRVLRWQWPNMPNTVSDKWFFVIQFLGKNDVVAKILDPYISQVANTPKENDWFIYRFDVSQLPQSACDPYWIVAVAKPGGENVSCSPGNEEDKICRLTDYSEPKLLGGRHPGAKCGSGPGNNGDTSNSDSGSLPVNP